MIVIDTSAVLAIINQEPERQNFLEIIAVADRCHISAVTLLETRIVIFARHGAHGIETFDRWLVSFSPEIVGFDSAQSAAAFEAFNSFGKGINSKSKLNFGDCASYALAKTRNMPLLFKGSDFAATDIEPAG